MIKKNTGTKSSRQPFGQAVLLLSCLALLLAFPAFAGDTFMMNANGTVQAGEQTFASFEEYTQSDYFRENGKRCGTKVPEIAADEDLAKSVNDCTFSLTNIQNEYWPGSAYVAKIWFHVIYQSNGTGNVSDAAIRAQVKVLSEDYRATAGTMGSQGFDTNIQFELAGITRTQNDAWFTDSAADEAAYKQALNKDPSKFINVYTNDASGYLGYAYFPQGGTAGQYFDGIVMNYQTIGGRNNGFSTYDQGRTLVHEMGHYMGLYHTFQDGSTCNNSYTGGDLIVDTPAESEAHFGCAQTNTCNSADPIHNYMDYTDDICMYKFSQEQGNRAVCGLVNYRPGIYSTNVPPPTPGSGASIIGTIFKPLLLNNSLPFNEDFEGAWPPAGWTIVDSAGTGLNWTRSDMAGTSNWCQFGSGFAAVADSDKLDPLPAIGMHTSLVSPPVNLTGPNAYLGYASNFQDNGGNGQIWLEISKDNGISWTLLRYQSTDDPPFVGDSVGGTWEVEDLSSYVGSKVLLRWTYSDDVDWAWYWHIDTIKVMNTSPTP